MLLFFLLIYLAFAIIAKYFYGAVMKNNLLLNFINSLSAEQRDDFARKCGTTTGMLKQICYGYRKCNPTLAIEIDKHSGGKVTCESLNKDADFDYLRNR